MFIIRKLILRSPFGAAKITTTETVNFEAIAIIFINSGYVPGSLEVDLI